MKGMGRNRLGGWALVLFCVAPLAAECIPEGECRDVAFPRPELPSGEGLDHPSYWDGKSGQPTAEEVDLFDNDPMPKPKGDGDPALIPMCNTSGDLLDGEGATQNGGVEGDCIEVQVCWTGYVYETRMVFSHLEFNLLDGGLGGGFTLIRTPVTKYWRFENCSKTREVCPEGDC